MGTTVYLGEIRTDDADSLIVVGGKGNSASHDGKPASDFANNYMLFLADMKKAGRKVNSIAVVNENTDYGTSVAGTVIESAKKAGFDALVITGDFATSSAPAVARRRAAHH